MHRACNVSICRQRISRNVSISASFSVSPSPLDLKELALWALNTDDESASLLLYVSSAVTHLKLVTINWTKSILCTKMGGNYPPALHSQISPPNNPFHLDARLHFNYIYLIRLAI